MLHLKSDDKEGISKDIASLSASSADEREVILSAELLGEVMRDEAEESQNREKANEVAVSLLSLFLKKDRKKSMESELHSRELLGGIFLRQGKVDQAQKTLETGVLDEAALSAPARASYGNIQRLRQIITKRTN